MQRETGQIATTPGRETTHRPFYLFPQPDDSLSTAFLCLLRFFAAIPVFNQSSLASISADQRFPSLPSALIPAHPRLKIPSPFPPFSPVPPVRRSLVEGGKNQASSRQIKVDQAKTSQNKVTPEKNFRHNSRKLLSPFIIAAHPNLTSSFYPIS
jgi:hypothetical protein